MIAEGVESRRRNSVHGISANQFLDVDDVAILWVLRSGAGPEQPLRLRAFGRQSIPTRAAKEFLIFLVGKLGIGNSDFTVETFKQGLLCRVRGCFQFFVNLAVDEGIDTADEEAGNAGDVTDVLALGRASLQSG